MAGAGQVCAMVMLSSKPCFNFVAFQGQPGSLAYPSGPAPPPGPGAPAAAARLRRNSVPDFGRRILRPPPGGQFW